MLVDIPDYVITEAVYDWIASEKFFPRVAELRTRARKFQNERSSTERGAFQTPEEANLARYWAAVEVFNDDLAGREVHDRKRAWVNDILETWEHEVLEAGEA